MYMFKGANGFQDNLIDLNITSEVYEINLNPFVHL